MWGSAENGQQIDRLKSGARWGRGMAWPVSEGGELRTCSAYYYLHSTHADWHLWGVWSSGANKKQGPANQQVTKWQQHSPRDEASRR